MKTSKLYVYKKVILKIIFRKFIKISLSNLTVTVEKVKNLRKRRIYSNFDPINELICLKIVKLHEIQWNFEEN